MGRAVYIFIRAWLKHPLPPQRPLGDAVSPCVNLLIGPTESINFMFLKK
jgi:hypothetical protein